MRTSLRGNQLYSIGEILLRLKFWYSVVVWCSIQILLPCSKLGKMDVNEAITEETPDLEQRVNELHGTMSNLAANLGAVDEQTRTNAGALAEQTVMLQGILRSLQMLSNDVLPF